jgi:hypothetical protein
MKIKLLVLLSAMALLLNACDIEDFGNENTIENHTVFSV